MKRKILAIITITFAACSSQPTFVATRDSIAPIVDTQRSAVKDSVTMKADTNEKKIDSSFKVLKDSMNKVK